MTDPQPFMGVAEISRRLGVSRRRLSRLAAESGFPEPCEELQSGRVWQTSDIEEWIASHQPLPR